MSIQQVEGKPVVVIHIPRASRQQRPVFVGLNPLDGTYRRYNEGDYRCSQDEVGRMLADQSAEAQDSRILDHYTLDDLDTASLQQYRNMFRSLDASHPWLAEDDGGLLTKLGGWRTDRATGQEGPTVAGLLMFGKDESLRDPASGLKYHVDYREKLSDDPERRWTDRLTIDGKWVANLFQFYRRVSVRLPQDVIKTPFRLVGGIRIDDTLGHQALREALVNTIIHADYRGMGGIVIEKRRGAIELSNPGSLLVSLDQLVKGGVSECRNPSLQTMFLMIGGGEKAGSGFDKIRSGWASQNLQPPRVDEITRPDRVRFILPTVSLLPEETLESLRRQFSRVFPTLGATEVQALVIAEQEGEVSNRRLRLACTDHASDLTRLLHGLVAKGVLEQIGQKRGTSYQVSRNVRSDSLHSDADSLHSDADSLHRFDELPTAEIEKLRAIAAPARARARLPVPETRRIILELCRNRFLTAANFAELTQRNVDAIRNRFLTPMVEEGVLTRKYPDEPNRPDQAYTKNLQESRAEGKSD